jgi:hypothetical protein
MKQRTGGYYAESELQETTQPNSDQSAQVSPSIHQERMLVSGSRARRILNPITSWR